MKTPSRNVILSSTNINELKQHIRDRDLIINQKDEVIAEQLQILAETEAKYIATTSKNQIIEQKLKEEISKLKHQLEVEHNKSWFKKLLGK